MTDSFAIRKSTLGIRLVLPKGNANFAWVQHFIHHLVPGGAGTAGGMAGFVLVNGGMSFNQSGEVLSFSPFPAEPITPRNQ